MAGEDRTAYWHGVDVNVTARLARGPDRPGRDDHRPRGARYVRAVARPPAVLDHGHHREPVGRLRRDRAVAHDRAAGWRHTGSRRWTCSPARRSARRGRLPAKTPATAPSLSANYQMPNTVVQQLLGRLPAGAFATGNTTVNLLAPSELYPLDRRTEVDIRIAKILRFGGTRLDVGVDVYNLFDAHTTTAYLQTYCIRTTGRRGSFDRDSRTAARPVECDPDVLSRTTPATDAHTGRSDATVTLRTTGSSAPAAAAPRKSGGTAARSSGPTGSPD